MPKNMVTHVKILFSLLKSEYFWLNVFTL